MAVNLQPVPNIGSQIERALIAYLAQFYDGDEPVNFYFSNDWRPRVPPLVDVLAHKSTESIPHTRNETYQVKIEAKWPGTNQPGVDNTEYNWMAINDLIGSVMAAMSVSDNGDPNRIPVVVASDITDAGRALAVDASNGANPAEKQGALNNSDMVNFTCEYVEFKGSQRAESGNEGLYLKEIRFFEIRAANSNVS
jgi:hypothetical protein